MEGVSKFIDTFVSAYAIDHEKLTTILSTVCDCGNRNFGVTSDFGK